MPPRKAKIHHADIVHRFADRLRELRLSRGMTQRELAEEAMMPTSYVWRLENAGAAPGIDLVDRLAKALGTTTTDLLPPTDAVDALPFLKERAKKLFHTILQSGDRDIFVMLNPLLARIAEPLSRYS